MSIYIDMFLDQLKGCFMKVKEEVHDVQLLLRQIEDLKKQLAEAKSVTDYANVAKTIADDVIVDVKEFSS